MTGKFNIRVYGILTDEKKGLLVSDELIKGNYYTKFPGGGLEYGEGTRDCLKREFMEEMNLNVEVLEHLYTTDFYQESAFRPGDQIVSIYYKVKALEPIAVRLSYKEFDFSEHDLANYKLRNEVESFRFIDWADVSVNSVTLPIDKVVVGMLLQTRSE
ncbi:MAG TPA: NUDIX domain-containing protein [Chitinophagaceae bacterium]|nr:NUDIX domain-containing protein [Chitinophagaceae bacterium]